MILRYIYDFFHYHFSGNPYCKENFYINILQEKFPRYRNKIKNDNAKIKLKEWIKNFQKFERIVVLGSGPSLNKLSTPSISDLYIATNSSVCKILKYHFIYFIFTRTYVNVYLRKGFKNKKWEGTIFRFTKNKLNHKNRMASYHNILKYKKKWKRNKPEIILTNIEGDIEKENFFELNNYIKQNLGFDFEDQNSGITALFIGYYIAKELNKPLIVYGIDAGINGNTYYNNKGITGKVTSSFKTKACLSKVLPLMKADKTIKFKNYSYYQP